MGFFKNLKNNIQNAKCAVEQQNIILRGSTARVDCKVAMGANHIFTDHFSMIKMPDGMGLINLKHKVKIISCSEYHETETGKSASKKIAGAIVGGVLTGGAGAIVGAMAVGNHKKKITKYNKLVAVDENNFTHEVILVDVHGQRQIINKYIN